MWWRRGHDPTKRSDLELLQSAVARPQSVFDGKESYPGIHHKAAVLLEFLIDHHPCIDGNNRTGITAAAMFLRINHYALTASNQEVESFVLSVASGGQTFDSILAWLQQHSTYQ